jgi:hypothetical protein
MPDELSTRLILSAVKNGSTIRIDTTDLTTLTGNPTYHGVQSIATSSTALEIGAVVTDGTIFIANRDATNFVEVSVDTGFASDNVFAKLFPGQWMYVPVKTRTLFVRANAAACLIECAAFPL